MGLFFFKKKVMRAALLLCALLAAPAVAPIGSSRGCATDCPPTQPKGCCTLSDGKTPWMYPGCTKECKTAVPNYCEGGTCKACPFGSYINSMPQTETVLKVVGSSANVKVTNGYGGKEICASPQAAPPARTFPWTSLACTKVSHKQQEQPRTRKRHSASEPPLLASSAA